MTFHFYGEPVSPDQRIKEACTAGKGGTSCRTVLPVVCLRPGDVPEPSGLSKSVGPGRVGGRSSATQPVMGAVFESEGLVTARSIMEMALGWRMAEFHEAGSAGVQVACGTGMRQRPVTGCRSKAEMAIAGTSVTKTKMFHVKPVQSQAWAVASWVTGLLLASLCGGVSAGAINKCTDTDARGRVTFSDKPCLPGQTTVVVQEAPPVPAPATAAAPAASGAVAASAPIAPPSAPKAAAAPPAAQPPVAVKPVEQPPALSSNECQRRKKFIEDGKPTLSGKDAQFRRAFATAEQEVIRDCPQ
jgi:hypothetical protein